MAFEAVFEASEFSAMRHSIAELIEGDAASRRLYGWALPATSTTDGAIGKYLIDQPARVPTPASAPPTLWPYDPCFYEDHLREASTYIDRSIARISEIQSLEVQAITTFLDY